MTLETLDGLLDRFEELGDREAVRFHNGFRTWKLSYRKLGGHIGGFQQQLAAAGLGSGDRLLIWSENRPEWLVAFWAAVASGIQVVPVDYQFSLDLVSRIRVETGAKLAVVGDGVPSGDLGSPRLPMAEVLDAPPAPVRRMKSRPDGIVEIVYTSGTTGRPVGVVHRHSNICANLRPIAGEVVKYHHAAKPFQPIRTLNLLPLSHMFGQSLGLFIPALLRGAVVFMTEMSPAAVLETIRRERISVVVAVPRMLTSLQRDIERRFDLDRAPNRHKGVRGILERFWRYRDVHRFTGWKFWALVVGGARVEKDAEEFWARLGYLVVQGYGLTETSPVVALNHPFSAQRGSIGKPIAGLEVKLAEDGEILVRGESVVAEYVAADGWFHTGDIGEMDQEGRLYYKARKKDMIVTSEGMNVYPQDVEAALNSLPAVREAVAVAARRNDQEVVHAALILSDATGDAAAVIEAANRRLEAHQRIRSWSVWPADDFPRTASTMKVKRGEVAAAVAGGTTAGSPADDPLALLEASGRLDMSSLERVELMAELEARYGVELDEKRFSEAESVDDLKAALKEAQESSPPRDRAASSLLTPRWALAPPVRWIRLAALEGLILPGFQMQVLNVAVEGTENLTSLRPPVIFTANHASNIDTIALMCALPYHWRHLLAPAMTENYFLPILRPSGFSIAERANNALEYLAACGLFQGYILPQHIVGVRDVLAYTGELADRGLCPLVYPEGRRTPDGRLQPFRPGIGLMAVRLRLPVVPVHVKGTFEMYPVGAQSIQRGNVHVRIGAVLTATPGEDYLAFVGRLEEAIRSLAEP